MKRSLIWFRNDLRVHDNEALVKAAQADEIIAVYCFDPRQFSTTSFGFQKTGVFRAKFLIESIQNLKEQLQKLGADLVVRFGKPEDIIPALMEDHKIELAFTHKEITKEEIDVEDAIKSKLQDKLSFVWGSTLFHINDIPYSKESIPDIFTSYRKKLEKESSVRKEYPIPSSLKLVPGVDAGSIPALPELGLLEKPSDERGVLSFMGGEHEALARLKDYFWKQDLIVDYKYSRNGLIGADYSSKFSPWLANGCLSPRRIYWELKKYESQRTKNVSTYWMIFELIWRDYFRFSAWKYGDKIFWPSGIQPKKRSWSSDRDVFDRWANGNTGIPFIDANMKELNTTGFMSNRGRQNVASFLAQNLNIDWRMGAEYFESLLLDYDPCSNYGNWAYNTTVGNDPRNRYFNIVGQAKKYDKKGEFIKRWLPQLEPLPKEFMHEPYNMNPDQQKLYSLELGLDYPEPMINLEESYEEIKARD